MSVAPDAEPVDLLAQYLDSLRAKAPATSAAYARTVRRFLSWLATRPGCAGPFAPAYLTRTAIASYLLALADSGASLNTRLRHKAALSSFATWLVEEPGLLRRNPTRGVPLPPAAALAPRELSADQRFVLHTLVERAGDRRSAALFALGYWAGCRVSDIAWLRIEHVHLTARTGWMHIGYKAGKMRDLDLAPQARQALYAYLRQPGLDPARPYVFASQRAARLTESGIHHWFRHLKALARKGEWELVADVSFHDLRHDFAHRARASGWSLEEVAYYLGHVTRQGTPAIQTTVRYTQVSRAAVKAKLPALKG
jgi:site-specific recombinase XerD